MWRPGKPAVPSMDRKCPLSPKTVVWGVGGSSPRVPFCSAGSARAGLLSSGYGDKELGTLTYAREPSYWQGLHLSTPRNLRSEILRASCSQVLAAWYHLHAVLKRAEQYGMLFREAARNHSEAWVPMGGDPGAFIRSECVFSLSWAAGPRESIR